MIFFFFYFLNSIVHASQFGDNSLIIQLNFPLLTHHKIGQQQNTTWFIMFYAPWCVHCKKMIPIWNELAEYYAENQSVKIASVDCDQEKEVKYKFYVSGYPSLILIAPSGLQYFFSAERSIEELIQFIEGGYNEQEGQPILEDINGWYVFLRKMIEPPWITIISFIICFVSFFFFIWLIDRRGDQRNEKYKQEIWREIKNKEKERQQSQKQKTA